MPSINIQLNTVDDVDFKDVSSKDALRRVVNMLVGQLGGAGPKSSSVTLAVGPNDQSIGRPLVYPFMVQTSGPEWELGTFSGYLNQPATGNANTSINQARITANTNTGPDTFGQYFRLTNRIAYLRNDVHNVGDIITLFGVRFMITGNDTVVTPNSFPQSSGVFGFMAAINMNPALRDKFMGIGTRTAWDAVVIVWIGGPDEDCPKWQYDQYSVAGDPSFDVHGWPDDINQGNPFDENANAVFAAAVSKVPLALSRVFNSANLDGASEYLDNSVQMVQGLDSEQNTFVNIFKIFT